MKNVAICIKGAVSKKGETHNRFYTENSIYRPGEYINYSAVRNSIFKHIINPNTEYNFDFFLHGWNLDLEKDLNILYSPKKILFENNNNYNTIIGNIITDPQDFGGVSGGLSIKKCLELKEIHEIETKQKYDIVIIYRYDVLLWKDIILDEYDTENYIYVNKWKGNCDADFHFIMSNQISYNFKYLYDSVYLYKNTHRFHWWIKNYIVNIMRYNIKEDSIEAGIDQEHMRVIGNNIELSKKIINYL